MVRYEEPKYSLIASFDNFEIRRYEQSILAITERSSSNYQGSSGAFRIIANYIFGGNISGQRIAMTAPVHIWNESSEIPKLAFTIPSQYSLSDLPEPNDSRVKISQKEEAEVAVLKFSGLAGNTKTLRLISKFKKTLKEEGIEITGDPKLAIYDNPWSTLPFARRNEIQIPVRL
ncbi:MAG: heme-binding protein [Euryarchaeota archaeon]|nr:heme-binding protein [Euryarchaeota archaeon]|tara:strand:- start:1159 stop:1680 length:522 start_codon:yes stop_codon:yes gene_type:complete